MPARDERLNDLFFVPQTGAPTEEGQLRLDGAALRAFIGGQVRSILSHAAEHYAGGAQPVVAQNLSSGAAALGRMMQADGAGGWSLVDVVPGVAAELNLATSEGADVTTSSSFLQKLRLNVTALPAGDYILYYSYVTSGSNNNTGIESRVQQDDVTDIQLVTNRAGSAGAQYANAGYKVLQALSGSHTFDIDWRRESGSGDAGILWARLALWLIDN